MTQGVQKGGPKLTICSLRSDITAVGMVTGSSA